MDNEESLIQVKKFFDKYKPLFAIALDMESRLELLASPRFSVFQYISKKNENNISSIIASLLDPKGTHGQKSLFLKEFIKQINKKIDLNFNSLEFDLTKIITESSTDTLQKPGRRIDIVVIGTNWVIGIENKPYTYEQKDQIADYTEHLKNKYKDKQIYFLYLSGKNTLSSSHDKNQPPILMGYNRGTSNDDGLYLSDWLKASRDLCQVDKVRHFCDDFLRFVQENFTSVETH